MNPLTDEVIAMGEIQLEGEKETITGIMIQVTAEDLKELKANLLYKQVTVALNEE